jgi:hypothetical protein
MIGAKTRLTVLVAGIMAVTQAATIDFTSAAAFAAATVNPNTINFNGILPSGTSFEPFSPLVVSGVSFSALTPGTFVNVTEANFYSPDNYSEPFIVDSSNPSSINKLLISFPSPVFALAVDYGGLGFSGVGIGTFTLSNGHVFTQPTLPTVGKTAFVGFVSTDPITSLQFAATNDSWIVTDFERASPVPEPTTYWMLGGSLLGMISLRQRRARKGKLRPSPSDL